LIQRRNAFDLPVGFLALRYARDEVDRAASAALREILLAAAAAFAAIAVIAPLALIVVIRRFERDMMALEAAAGHLEDRAESLPTGNSSFDSAIATLRASLTEANQSLDDLRAKLDTAG